VRVVMAEVVAVLSTIAGQAFAESASAEESSMALGSSRMASSRISAEHLQQYSDLALAWM